MSFTFMPVSFLPPSGGGGGGGGDLTAAQVKALYESNENTNAFTDSEKEKLANLPASAALAAEFEGKVDVVEGSSLMTTAQADKLAELPTAAELTNSFAEKADLIDIPRQTYRGNFPSLAELKAALGDAHSGDTADVIEVGSYGDFLRYACMSPGDWVQINTGAPANPNIPYTLIHNTRLGGRVTYTSDLSGTASYPHNSATIYYGNVEHSWPATAVISGAVHVSANDNESRRSSLLSCGRPGSGIGKGVSYFEFSVRRSYENPIARMICGPDNLPQSNPIDFDKSGTVTASDFQNRTGGGLNKLESRTKATLPAAAANANQMYFCTDAEGGAAPVISNGTAWLAIQTTPLA